MALLKLALRNLRRNRRRSAITLAALVLGVAAMVAIRGFIVGVRGMLLGNQMTGTLGALQVHKRGYVENVLGSPLTINLADTPELRATIAGVPGVAGVAPRIEFGAQLAIPDRRPPPDDGTELPEADRGKSSFLLVTAIDPMLERAVTPKRWEWVGYARGQMLRDSSGPDLVLNDDFARSMGAPLWPDGVPLPPPEQQLALLAADQNALLNGENVALVGTLASATPNDRRMGLMGLASAQRLLRMEGRVTEYGVALQPGADLAQVRQALATTLGDGYEVHTWEQRMPFAKDMVTIQDTVFGIVSTIFLIVVLLIIVNAMLMSVLERVREIGTMLAVGVRRRQIATLFLLEGLVIGVIGGLLGVAVGVLVVALANRTGILIPAPGAKIPSFVRPDVSALFVAGVFVRACLGASLAALWPAIRASRLRPVEALSHT